MIIKVIGTAEACKAYCPGWRAAARRTRDTIANELAGRHVFSPLRGTRNKRRMFKIFSRKHLERVKHVWGAGRVWGGSEIQHWLQHPLVQERINLKISAMPGVNRFEYFLN